MERKSVAEVQPDMAGCGLTSLPDGRCGARRPGAALRGGDSVRKRALTILAGSALAAALIGPIAAGAAGGSGALPTGQTGIKGLPQRNPNAPAGVSTATAT